MPKRLITPPSSRQPAKKSRENERRAASPFDGLCDNNLLQIASYADVRSVIYLARRTCKSLRDRPCFDPRNENSSGHGCMLWRDVFADLRMAPLDEGNESLDCLRAIGYRQSLYNRLIRRDKDADNETGENTIPCASLPLVHHHFKPLSRKFNQEGDNDREPTLFGPFVLLSGGTGGGYAMIDPETFCLEVHNDILENAIRLDKIVQGSNGADNEGAWALQKSLSKVSDKTSEVLMSSVSHHFDRPVGLQWEDFFGRDTPRNNVRNFRRLQISNVIVDACDELDEGGIMLKEKQILMMRVVEEKAIQENVCTEIAMWVDSIDAGNRNTARPSPSQNFRLKKIWRLPGSGDCFDMCLKTDFLYMKFNDVSLSNIPGDHHLPSDELMGRAVFRFPLNGSSMYPESDLFFLAANEVSHLEVVGRDLLLVGTKQGTIEIWKEVDQSAPRAREGRPHLLHTLRQEDTFPADVDLSPNRILGIQPLVTASLCFGFVTIQVSLEIGTVISLWQTPTLNLDEEDFDAEHADFQIMAKIKYDCLLAQIIFGSRHLLVLAYDDQTGRMYLDIYHVFSSRFGFSEFGGMGAPHNSIIYVHPEGKHRIKFANRIDIRHRIDVPHTGARLGFPERMPLVSANHRFLTVIANDGLKGSDGSRKTGPGMIVIDLDEHGVSV